MIIDVLSWKGDLFQVGEYRKRVKENTGQVNIERHKRIKTILKW